MAVKKLFNQSFFSYIADFSNLFQGTSMKTAPLFLTSITLLSAFVFADDINPVPTEMQSIPSPKKERQVTPSARPQVQGGINVYLTGDWLYFKPQEKGLTYALQATATPTGDLWTNQNGSFISTNFSWQSGFRVGLGWNTKHDGWDFLLAWTRFYTHEQDSVTTVGTNYVFPTLADPNLATSPVTSASAYYKLHLNQLELILGREFYVSKALSLKPKVAVIADWISQKFNVDYENPSGVGTQPAGAYDNINNKNNFWGAGLKAGLNTQWELGWGFSIFGDGAFSLLYGKFDVSKQGEMFGSIDGTDTFSSINLTDNFYLARYIADLSLGMRWDYMFSDDRIHFGLQIGWEDHIYFGQNQFLITPNANYIGLNDNENQDLTLQGVVIGARLDF
jgi:hypothetical protein